MTTWVPAGVPSLVQSSRPLGLTTLKKADLPGAGEVDHIPTPVMRMKRVKRFVPRDEPSLTQRLIVSASMKKSLPPATASLPVVIPFLKYFVPSGVPSLEKMPKDSGVGVPAKYSRFPKAMREGRAN